MTHDAALATMHGAERAVTLAQDGLFTASAAHRQARGQFDALMQATLDPQRREENATVAVVQANASRQQELESLLATTGAEVDRARAAFDAACAALDESRRLVRLAASDQARQDGELLPPAGEMP